MTKCALLYYFAINFMLNMSSPSQFQVSQALYFKFTNLMRFLSNFIKIKKILLKCDEKFLNTLYDTYYILLSLTKIFTFSLKVLSNMVVVISVYFKRMQFVELLTYIYLKTINYSERNCYRARYKFLLYNIILINF